MAFPPGVELIPATEIWGTGYVVHSLEAALWAFRRVETFKEGAGLAANLVDDAHTTSAVYGQLAGACYGKAGLLKRWVGSSAFPLLIEIFPEGPHDLTNSPAQLLFSRLLTPADRRMLWLRLHKRLQWPALALLGLRLP